MNELEITSPEKILFPKGKIKKIDVINYYIDICKYNNIMKECFLWKH